MANSTQIPADSTTSGREPTVQDQINLALATNGGLKRIEAVMQQRLDEAGWSQNLREYVTKLLRSGEATTYDDCLAKVMAAVNAKEGANGVNGSGGAVHAPDLKMPEDAAQDAAAAVKKEISPLLVEKKDDVEETRRDSAQPIMETDRPETGRPAHDDESEDAENENADLLGTAACHDSSNLLLVHTTTFPEGQSVEQTFKPRRRGLTVYGSRRWAAEEDALILQLKSQPATNIMTWLQISSYFNNRTVAALRNRFSVLSSSRQPDPAMKSRSAVKPWTAVEDRHLRQLMRSDPTRDSNWVQRSACFDDRTPAALESRWRKLLDRHDSALDPT